MIHLHGGQHSPSMTQFSPGLKAIFDVISVLPKLLDSSTVLQYFGKLIYSDIYE